MMEFWVFFCDFRAILRGFGGPGPSQNSLKISSKTLQKSILRRVLDKYAFEGGFWKVFGRVLDGFWEDFGRVLGGFLRRFWEDGHAKNDIWADKFYVPELLVYGIRL